jgi:hypothetical protein
MDNAVLLTWIVRFHLYQNEVYQFISRYKWAHIPRQVQTDSLTIPRLYFLLFLSIFVYVYGFEF